MNNNSYIITVPGILSTYTVKDVIQQFGEFLKSNNNSFIIDFSRTRTATPGGLTPLLCYLLDLKNILKRQCTGYIKESDHEIVEQYISRMGFYEILEIDKKNPVGKEKNTAKFQELYCFSKETPENELFKKNENIIKTFTSKSDKPNYIKAIQWCVVEMIDNARMHAESMVNVLFAQYYPDADITEFCVADRGLGIRETMGEYDIKIALERCIKKEKGINSTGMGNGLHYIAELIKTDNPLQNNFMSIISENAMLYIKSGQKPKIDTMNAFWKGTVVTLSLNYSIESDIESIKGSEVYGAEDLPDFYE